MLHKSAEDEALFWAIWIALCAAFAGLAYWVSGSYYLPGDRAITFGIQDLYTQPWADNVFNAASRVGDPLPIGLALGFLVGMLGGRRRFVEVSIVCAAAVSIIGVGAFEHVIERPTGEYDAMRAAFDGLFHPRIYPDPGGFPSGHVFGTVVAYGMLFWLVERALRWNWLIALIQLGCVVAIGLGFVAPMYLGTHWFTDCVGGVILAGLVLVLGWRVDAFAHRNVAPGYVRDLVGYRTPRTAADARAPRTTTRYR